jgi:hypothetical protein
MVLFPKVSRQGLLLTLMPLLSPRGWDYAFLRSTPAVVYLANYEVPWMLRAITIVAVASVGLTVFDLVGRTAYQTFMQISGVPLCFFVVITALCALRRPGIA